MSGVTDGLHAVTTAWADAMWRASWQGTLAFGLVWLVIRLLPQLPGALRCWLWRLAFLKLLVALLWAGPLALPVLPAHPGAAAVPPVLTIAALPEGSSPQTTPLAALERMGSRRQPVAPSLGASSAGPSRHIRTWQLATLRQPPVVAPLCLLWLVGVCGGSVRLMRQWGRVRCLRQALVPVEDENLVGIVADLGSVFRLRRLPKLASGPVDSPALMGMLRPAILLPGELRQTATPAELRLVIAHELAHLKRHDLLWGWLPVLAQCLFFFHPLVWLARGEHRLAQEMAADEMAVRGTEASIGEYAAMLLRLAARRRGGSWELGAVGALASGTTLERRLTLLTHLRPRGPALRLGALATLLAVIGLAPWCVTAQSAPSSRSRVATPTASPAHAAVTATPTTAKPAAVLAPRTSASPERTLPAVAAAPSLPAPPTAAADAPARAPAAVNRPDARPAAPNTDQTGVISEDMLLLEATRYLRLSDTQLRQLFALAQTADGRLTQLRTQEDQSLASLHQIALRQREALLAGRNSSAREQANALTLRQTLQQRRAETEAAIVQEVLPQLARLLAPTQVERAFLLSQGQVPPGDAAEPALLDPAAGFVTNEKQRSPMVLPTLGGKIAHGGAPGAPAPAGSLAQQLLSAQQRMTDMQRGLMKLNMAGDNGPFIVADRLEVRLPDGVAAGNAEDAAKLKKAIASNWSGR